MRLSLGLPGGVLKLTDGPGLVAARKHGAPHVRLGRLYLVWWSSSAQAAVRRRRMRAQRRF